MFITFEGIDGSGKTTQALKLKSWLEEQGHEVLYTFEPGGCELCKGIRELLLSNSIKDDIARLILFLGDRKLHVESVIEPALKSGKIVICDRYNDSSIAYQSAAGLDYKFVREFVKSFNFIEPDITFMFDIKAEDALRRLEGRGRDKDAVESSGVKFLSCVREIYKDIAACESRIILIDADKSELEIADLIRDYIKNLN
ncbi:MAG: dTMP kinase [Synergistaceae bacterium]|nr:dTMP kinase [Synergistaceae bacterium]